MSAASTPRGGVGAVGLAGGEDANTKVAGLWDVAANGVGLLVDPEDP